jgi:hypothetical protein
MDKNGVTKLGKWGKMKVGKKWKKNSGFCQRIRDNIYYLWNWAWKNFLPKFASVWATLMTIIFFSDMKEN